MIAQVITSLALLSLMFLWKTKARYDTLLATFLTVIFGAAFCVFANAWISGYEDSYSVIWDSTRSGDVALSINSDLSVYRQVFPFFVITFMALFNNVLFRYETKKKNLAVFIVLNFISMVMIITAQHFIQLITFVFIIDMISQFLIRDINAGRRYALYNLTADMGLFLAFAILRSDIVTLDLSSLGQTRLPFHNFIAALILVSLCIKFGFFIFHSFFLDLKSARFHRFFLVFYLSSPMTALILSVKLFPLLQQCEWLDIIINVIVLLNLGWGTLGSVIIRNLKEKTVYLNMMIFSVMFKLLTSPEFIWNNIFSSIIITAFMFNMCIYYIHYYIWREKDLDSANKLHYFNLLPVYMVSMLCILLLADMSMLLLTFVSENVIFVIGFIILFACSVAHLCIQTLQNDVAIKSLRADYDNRPFGIFIMILSAVIIIFVHQNLCVYAALPALTSFAIFFIISPLQIILKTNTISYKLQQVDIFKNIYDKILAKPLQIIGKYLTLFVDFMFFEKTLMFILGTINGFTVRIFRKIGRTGSLRYFIFVLITLSLLFTCMTRGFDG